MRSDLVETALISLDAEVEAPVAVYAGLPDAQGLMVLFGAQRRMVEVLQEETNLFEKGSLHMHRRGGVLPEEVP
jgi:hypothetical protein